ncbi:hypothetical protein NCER_100392 [Vairimorpha ceranae BRL01]|uniref:Uncharacterized protein n=2 Tax=Vairimorpha ceranae TaxID=40302 RepID=C4V7G3_VAIC1|nr:hypothetical protein NCER_100392 [Vairimorpha ceranae BRL01]
MNLLIKHLFIFKVFLFIPMVSHGIKDTLTYSNILNEDIEKKLNRIKINKKYLNYMNNIETSFDSNSSSFTSGVNSFYEDFVKKKKSNNVNMVDNVRLDDDEIIQDLNEIYDDGGLMVRILDSSVYINSEKFSKHDKVLVKMDKDEYLGSITGVDTDVVIKFRDGRRNRIKLEDIKNGKVNITRYIKQ